MKFLLPNLTPRRCLPKCLNRISANSIMNIAPTATSLRSILSSCSNNQHHAKQAHAQILRTNPPSPSLLTLLLLSYSRSSLNYALTLFSTLPDPTIFHYNPLLRALSSSKTPQQTITFFRSMLRNSCSPNHLTFPFLIKACARSLAHRTGATVHARTVRNGLEHDPYIQSALIHFYITAAKDLASAHRVFGHCHGSQAVCWNAMIDGFVRFGEIDLGRSVFDRMECRDVVSWNTMINGYSLLARLKEARELFDRMPERNVVSWNSIIACHAKCGDVTGVREVFREMPRRDVVSWNAMIACCVQGGCSDEAIAVFDEMQRVGVRPTESTFVSLLSACVHIGNLVQGERIHELIREYQTELSTVLATALVDMYAKCGRILQACKIFDAMEHKDLLAWNAIIAGMAFHGKAEEALRLFGEMIESGNRPDDLTFVAVLTACSHSGMVREGRQLFNCMKETYGVEPKVEHYGCVLDLLARKGLLEEAVEQLKAMPLKPNAPAWGALLSGCRIHENAEVADGVGKHLIDLQPENSGRYTLLSNIYARKSRWEDAGKVRGMMVTRGVTKTPGMSIV